MQGVLDKIVEEAKDSDEIKIPLNPTKNDEVEARYSFFPSVDVLIAALNPETEVCEKIINYSAKRGAKRGGLYARMPVKDQSLGGEVQTTIDTSENQYIWYVCAGEINWFKFWFNDGQIDKCREIVEDILNYVMSEEYYMVERYHQRNVWYAPWSPNASCNGRMIIMMTMLYGDK